LDLGSISSRFVTARSLPHPGEEVEDKQPDSQNGGKSIRQSSASSHNNMFRTERLAVSLCVCTAYESSSFAGSISSSVEAILMKKKQRHLKNEPGD